MNMPKFNKHQREWINGTMNAWAKLMEDEDTRKLFNLHQWLMFNGLTFEDVIKFKENEDGTFSIILTKDANERLKSRQKRYKEILERREKRLASE